MIGNDNNFFCRLIHPRQLNPMCCFPNGPPYSFSGSIIANMNMLHLTCFCPLPFYSTRIIHTFISSYPLFSITSITNFNFLSPILPTYSVLLGHIYASHWSTACVSHFPMLLVVCVDNHHLNIKFGGMNVYKIYIIYYFMYLVPCFGSRLFTC